MRQITTILITVAVLAAMLTMPAAAIDADDETEQTPEDVEPGEKLAGVIAVQDAELDAEISERSFGIQVANAHTDNDKASVASEQLENIEQRITDHEEKRAELEQAHEAGDISTGEYQSEMARLHVDQSSTERLAEGTEAVAKELPEEVLEENGINVAAIEELRTNASELGGQEVAAIAQSIAGDKAGDRMPSDRQTGPPADVGPNNNAADDKDQDEDETDSDDGQEQDEQSSPGSENQPENTP